MRISDWSSDVCSSDLNLGFQPIAYELLVERRRTDTQRIARSRPKARGIRRQDLVHQVQLALIVKTEFEFGVGNDNALVRSKLGCFGIQTQGDRAYVLGKILPNLTHHVVEINVLRSEEHTSELQSLMRISYAV